MHHLLSAAADPSLHANLAAGADIVSGVTPDWGPFSKLGGTAKVLLGVLAAIVLVIGGGAFLAGVGKSKGWFGEGHSTMESSRGKGMMVGGLTVIFLVASFGTIFAITYGMGV
ncbi:membrane protein [Kitasatospora nipponensis]|uniref:Membrane protein n=1 Tax=Kitasatospora nipponensis TaxID=258049 RepID=A0ABN1VPW3_9ACTN